MSPTHPQNEYTSGEEMAHALTHDLGALLSVAGLGAMVALSLGSGGPERLWSTAIFGVSLVVLYTASTLYHATPRPRLKAIFQTFDHVAIYALIAGTFTPFALIAIGGNEGWTPLATIWGLAFAGTAFEFLTKGKRMKLALEVAGRCGRTIEFSPPPDAEPFVSLARRAGEGAQDVELPVFC